MKIFIFRKVTAENVLWSKNPKNFFRKKILKKILKKNSNFSKTDQNKKNKKQNKKKQSVQTFRLKNRIFDDIN